MRLRIVDVIGEPKLGIGRELPLEDSGGDEGDAHTVQALKTDGAGMGGLLLLFWGGG